MKSVGRVEISSTLAPDTIRFSICKASWPFLQTNSTFLDLISFGKEDWQTLIICLEKHTLLPSFSIRCFLSVGTLLCCLPKSSKTLVGSTLSLTHLCSSLLIVVFSLLFAKKFKDFSWLNSFSHTSLFFSLNCSLFLFRNSLTLSILNHVAVSSQP